MSIAQTYSKIYMKLNNLWTIIDDSGTSTLLMHNHTLSGFPIHMFNNRNTKVDLMTS